ncbi:hypothetical protein GCM10009712_23090 [Pseudarthrobacter sulfonivorans]
MTAVQRLAAVQEPALQVHQDARQAPRNLHLRHAEPFAEFHLRLLAEVPAVQQLPVCSVQVLHGLAEAGELLQPVKGHVGARKHL